MILYAGDTGDVLGVVLFLLYLHICLERCIDSQSMTSHGKEIRNNILLLIADDLGKFLGCYGCKTIHTPNIDELAKQGTKFEAAFASTASCSGSRSTIYTGLHTHQNGQYGLAGQRNHFMTFDDVETAPSIFNSIGYRTGVIGKIHVGPSSVYPWQVREESPSRNVTWVAERAGAFFQSAKTLEVPFHLTVGFIDPHRDLTRSGFGNTEQNGPGGDNGYSQEQVEIPSYLQDIPEVRLELAQYYRSIHRMDRGVGLVLEQLRQSGLEDDTLVVFLSDNGPPFINSKTTLYDAGVCLPLIIKQPGRKAGISSPNMVSFIDILPTTLDFVGCKALAGKRLGRSVLPILESSIVLGGWDKVFGSHTFHEQTNYWPTRYVRTRKFKYHRNIAHKLDFPFASDLYASLTFEGIRNSLTKPVMVGKRLFRDFICRPAEELYDLENDPDEVKNLANDAQFAKTLRELRITIEEWQSSTQDPWLFRDGTKVSAMTQYLLEGLPVPDQWDMDSEDPSTINRSMFKAI